MIIILSKSNVLFSRAGFVEVITITLARSTDTSAERLNCACIRTVLAHCECECHAAKLERDASYHAVRSRLPRSENPRAPGNNNNLTQLARLMVIAADVFYYSGHLATG